MAQWNRHRQDNTIRVLEALWRDTGLSRADLARRLRLDRSTVGSCVDELLAMNLVYEGERGGGGPVGGRPPVLLSLRRDYGYSIGVDLTGDRIVCIASDLGGHTILRREYEHAAAPDELISLLTGRIGAVRGELAEMGHSRLLGVAVGAGGMVDTARGAVLLSRSLGIRAPLVLGPDVADAVGVPVWVLNDADACAIGELEYGRGRSTAEGPGRDILFVLVRYTVPDTLADARLNAGLGIVLDGRLREAYSGGGREFRSPFVAARSAEQFAAADAGRAGAYADRAGLEAAFADELGLSVSFLVHALDLRNVVLGGDVLGGTADYDAFDERIRFHVTSSTARVEPQPLELYRPFAGDQAVAFGASAAAIRRLFRQHIFPLDTDAPLVREKA